MDAELAKVAPELTKAVVAAVTGFPLADIVKRICGPPADVLGDKLKERVERCFEKTAKMTQDAGIKVQAVPPKLLFPILQGASVEDNEELHTMFAALLANAASPDHAEKVKPMFLGILGQIGADEAKLLWIIKLATDAHFPLDSSDGRTKDELDQINPMNVAFVNFVRVEFAGGEEKIDASQARREASLQILQQLGLVVFGGLGMGLTVLGRMFLAAVTPPATSKNG